jgi:hypothetical protein
MKHGMAVLATLALLLPALAGQAEANDQEIVIGAGLGLYSFSKSDDFRAGSGAFQDDADEISSGGMFQLYGEWYLFDDVGLGLRHISVAGGRTYSYLDAEQTDTASVTANLITVNWVPLGSEDYVRMGVLAGIGGARYEAKTEVDFASDTLGEDISESDSTSGTATLLGVYVDWGGESFGARFGLNALQTDLDTVELSGQELNVDGTGTALYFDLRWAWE